MDLDGSQATPISLWEGFVPSCQNFAIKVGDASPGNKCDQPGSSGFNFKKKQDNASSKHGRAENIYRSIVTALLGKKPTAT